MYTVCRNQLYSKLYTRSEAFVNSIMTIKAREETKEKSVSKTPANPITEAHFLS